MDIDLRFERNKGIINKREQKKLLESKVVIAGSGATGSATAEILARVGVGNFIVIDPDRIDETNINRQIIATRKNIGKYKARELAKRLRNIGANVKAYIGKAKEFKDKLEDIDLFIDCTDSYASKKENWEITKAPYLFTGVEKNTGMVSIMKKEWFREIKQRKRKLSVSAITVFLTSSIAANQAIKYLLGKKHIEFPELLIIDAEENKINKIKLY